MQIRCFLAGAACLAFVACGDDSTGGNNQNNNNGGGQCGNGVLDTGEQCDDGEENSDLAPDACRTSCRRAWCGDGIIDTGEVCDTDDLNNATCQSEGFTKGILSCNDQCELDTSGCSTCGDGTADGSDINATMYESCDGSDLRGQDCVSVGQASGILACNEDCTWDFSLCLGGAVCVSDADCANGQQICDNHICRACSIGECGTGRVCADGFCLAGDCYINSSVWNEGDTDPTNVCNVCTRASSPTSWSPNGGETCDDGNDCTYGDTCSASVPGICAGQSYTCPNQACTVGVCHGTGPSDCTEEMLTTWNGCFIDGSCYNNNQARPGNGCQLCDAANNAWTPLPAGTRCDTCQICTDPGSGMVCDFVGDGLDPNNDCTANCQVCNGYGICRWADASTDPNDDCTASNISTCGFNGECEGGSDQCAYHTGGVGVVDDGNPCTYDDSCDGAGGKTGTAYANTTPNTRCLSTKICVNGTCTNCTLNTQCGTGYVCVNGDCTSGACASAGDCTGDPGVCHEWTCNGSHQCVASPLSSGSCSVADQCVTSASCVSGTCTPQSYVDCTSSGPDCTTWSCNPSSGSCEMDYINSDSCLISSGCYSNGEANPSNWCELCNTTTSQTTWSDRALNTTCSATTDCQSVCRSGSCLARFSVGSCKFGMIWKTCIDDVTNGRSYYNPDLTCPPGEVGYNTAVSTCTALGTGWQLATHSEYAAMDNGGSNCTHSSCDGVTIDVDPAFDSQAIDAGQHYWVRYTGTVHEYVYFDGTGAHFGSDSSWAVHDYAVMCVHTP